jgi:hypothetical protein
VGIPEGAPMVSFDATDEEIAAVVPPEIDFFEPDPAPPATDDQ